MSFPHAEIRQQQEGGQSDFRAVLADVLSRQMMSPTGKIVRSHYNRPARKSLSSADRMKNRIRFFAGCTESPPTGSFLMKANEFGKNGIYHSALANGKTDELARGRAQKQQQAQTN